MDDAADLANVPPSLINVPARLSAANSNPDEFDELFKQLQANSGNLIKKVDDYSLTNKKFKERVYQKIAEIDILLKDITNKIRTIIEERTLLQERQKQFQTEQNKLQDSIKQIQQANTQLITEKKSCETQITDLRGKNASLISANTTLTSQNKDFEEVKARNKEFTRQKAENDAKIKDLTRTIESIEVEIRDQNLVLGKANTDRDQLLNKQQRLKEQLVTINGQIASKIAYIDNLMDTVSQENKTLFVRIQPSIDLLRRQLTDIIIPRANSGGNKKIKRYNMRKGNKKTNKKRNKSKRGGWVYKSNERLDSQSSEITTNTGSNSDSKYRSKSRTNSNVKGEGLRKTKKRHSHYKSKAKSRTHKMQ